MTKVVIHEDSVVIYTDGRYITCIFHDGESEVLNTPDFSCISLRGLSRIYPEEIVDARKAVK